MSQLLDRLRETAREGARSTVRTINDYRARQQPVTVLTPQQALQENGFTVFRGLFGPAETAELTRKLKTEAKITAGKKYTKVDVANFFPTARDLLLEGRIVSAVQAAIGADARFLQVGDLHYLHDTAGWHRDSVHRAHDSSASPDWADPGTPYRVVKAILYLEAENAAMGIMGGSHLSPVEMDHGFVKAVEDRHGQLIIGPRDEPNRRFTADQRRTPWAWQPLPGDVLVFDERMYHAGRRVEHGKVTKNLEAPKFALSMVFGPTTTTRPGCTRTSVTRARSCTTGTCPRTCGPSSRTAAWCCPRGGGTSTGATPRSSGTPTCATSRSWSR